MSIRLARAASMLQDIMASAIAAVLVLSASFSGLFLFLGAHPWWSSSVALIGASIGFFAGLSARRFQLTGLVPSLLPFVLTIGAFGLAWFGKNRFAESFAEDVLAGHFWYFGWIATAAFATVTLSLLPRGR